MFTTEQLIAICGVVIAIVSVVISYYFNKKTLKQSQKNLELQLLHEDRKKALFELNKIVSKAKKYHYMKDEIITFLKSPEGQFAPQDLIKFFLSSMEETDNILKSKGLDKVLDEYAYPEPTEEEELEYEYAEIQRLQDPFEFVEDRIKDKFLKLRSEFIEKTNEKLKNLPKG